MEEWGIVRSLVTDAAPNAISCAKILKVHHTRCISHTCNLIVRKSTDQTPGLEEIRVKSRKMALVGHFRSSTFCKREAVPNASVDPDATTKAPAEDGHRVEQLIYHAATVV